MQLQELKKKGKGLGGINNRADEWKESQNRASNSEHDIFQPNGEPKPTERAITDLFIKGSQVVTEPVILVGLGSMSLIPSTRDSSVEIVKKKIKSCGEHVGNTKQSKWKQMLKYVNLKKIDYDAAFL